MLTFKRCFQTRQQAMDVYRSQLSSQKLYVESFEGYTKGTEVCVELEIRETHQNIRLSGTVERLIGKKEATDLGYGQRPGLLLSIPITQEIIAPLRAFFLANTETSNNTPTNAPTKPTQIIRPGMKAPQPVSNAAIPFENISKCSFAQAQQEVNHFFELVEHGNVFQLLNVQPNTDKKELRRIYNIAVRSLHPDSQSDEFDSDFSEKLGEVYQIFNEAYQLLQHPIKKSIYQEISRLNHTPNGMSLNAYKKWRKTYRIKNASNINMADELVSKAQDAISKNNIEEAKQHIKLALQYDQFNESARSIQL